MDNTYQIIAIYIQTFVTLIVGGIAWFVYKSQKKDHKKDSAKAILLEIQAAESAIKKVREAIQNEHLDVDVSILPSESWSTNKHLFVRDFDKDEWELVSEFYNKALLIDEAIKYNKTGFASDVEQIRINKQRVFASYAEEAIKEAVNATATGVGQQIEDIYDLKWKAFDKLYMDRQVDFQYKPLKPINDVKLYLSDLNKVTTSTVGGKLKRLAK